MIRKLLAAFGYHKVTQGYYNGIHWIEFNGKKVYQGDGADLFMWNPVVVQLQDLIFRGIGCRRIFDGTDKGGSGT